MLVLKYQSDINEKISQEYVIRHQYHDIDWDMSYYRNGKLNHVKTMHKLNTNRDYMQTENYKNKMINEKQPKTVKITLKTKTSNLRRLY